MSVACWVYLGELKATIYKIKDNVYFLILIFMHYGTLNNLFKIHI